MEQASTIVDRMIATMDHSPNYVKGRLNNAKIGIYVQWTAHKDTCAAQQPYRAFGDQQILFLSGEYPGCRRTIASTQQSEAAALPTPIKDLLQRYARSKEAFFSALNGPVCGLLVDESEHAILLFTDRSGAERIYFTEDHGTLYFATEAKAILAVRANTRRFDETALLEYLSFGCTLGTRSLFHSIRIVPPGGWLQASKDHLSSGIYFDATTLEGLPPISDATFAENLASTLRTTVPNYIHSGASEAVSLTGGLDTRLILAAAENQLQSMPCFTYSGADTDPLDVRIAKKVASKLSSAHHTLHLESDFFSSFAAFAKQTVYISDGYAGITGAHELYLSRKARELAAVRITGNYGGELLRGISTLKPQTINRSIFNDAMARKIDDLARNYPEDETHPTTFALKKEIPYALFGNLAVGRSQIGFRSPFLDNEVISLAYKASSNALTSRSAGLSTVRKFSAGLAGIATDKGDLGGFSFPFSELLKTYLFITFKLDYYNNEGFPTALMPLERVFRAGLNATGLLGLHKHLHYRSWLRDPLSAFLTEKMTSIAVLGNSLWNRDFLSTVAARHIEGQANFVAEINLILTIAEIEESLLHSSNYSK